MFLQIPELQKNTQFFATNENNSQQLFHLFSSFNFLRVSFIFWAIRHLLINTSSFKLQRPIIIIIVSLV
jgi:hypothetical protein